MKLESAGPQLPSVCVLTPTIVDRPRLLRCAESVVNQDYKGLIAHTVVVDGDKGLDPNERRRRQDDLSSVLRSMGESYKAVSDKPRDFDVVTIPYPTGRGGYYGHRIYAGFSYLLNHDIVFFCDEDNFYAPNHVSSLVELILAKGYDWAYSLRAIVDKEGTFLCDDNCESLGRFTTWSNDPNAPAYNLVDTSCYAFRIGFLRQVGGAWCSSWGGDRKFYETIVKGMGHDNFGCSTLHSLFYRTGISATGPDPRFYEVGNKKMAEAYGDQFPWHRKP